MADLTCHDVAGFLFDYFEDTLEATQRRIFETHLAKCDECVRYLRDYADSVRLGKAAFAADDLNGIPSELVTAILAARRRMI